jgi:hypothetical protein
MSEESVTVLRSKIGEERLHAIVAKRPLFPFFSSTVSILGSRTVHYPYWCVSLEATAIQKLRKDHTVKLLVTVDAVTGDTGYGKSIPEGSQVPEGSVPDTIKVRVTRNEAWKKAEDFALDLFMRKIFFLKEVSREIKETRLIYYPYWVVDIQKGGETSRRAVDAIHGEVNNKVVHHLEEEE